MPPSAWISSVSRGKCSPVMTCVWEVAAICGKVSSRAPARNLVRPRKEKAEGRDASFVGMTRLAQGARGVARPDLRPAAYQEPATQRAAKATTTSTRTATMQPIANALPVPTVVLARGGLGADSSRGSSRGESATIDASASRGHGSTTTGPVGAGGPKRKNVSSSHVPFSKTKSIRCGRGSPPSVTST